MLKLMNFLTIISLFATVFADSDIFTLVLSADGTDLESASLYLSDEKFEIAHVISESAITAYIMSNGTLVVNGNSTVGIGKNYLSIAGFSSSYEMADPWSIEDGYLKLYASDFHAVPSGEDDIYVLGSINAAASRSDVISVAIQAIASGNTEASDYYPENYVDSSSSVSLLASTQTYNSQGTNYAASNEINYAIGLLALGMLI